MILSLQKGVSLPSPSPGVRVELEAEGPPPRLGRSQARAAAGPRRKSWTRRTRSLRRARVTCLSQVRERARASGKPLLSIKKPPGPLWPQGVRDGTQSGAADVSRPARRCRCPAQYKEASWPPVAAGSQGRHSERSGRCFTASKEVPMTGALITFAERQAAEFK